MKAIFITLCAFISLNAQAFAYGQNDEIDSIGPSVYPTPDGDSDCLEQTDFLTTTTDNKTHSYEPTKADKSIIISVDGKEMSGIEYINEYVTICTYVPETKKFVVHKCKQDRHDELKDKSFIKKDHHRRDGHGGNRAHSRDVRRRRVQWLRCTDCGMYLRGYEEGSRHFDCTGHKHFQRIDVQ